MDEKKKRLVRSLVKITQQRLIASTSKKHHSRTAQSSQLSAEEREQGFKLVNQFRTLLMDGTGRCWSPDCEELLSKATRLTRMLSFTYNNYI